MLDVILRVLSLLEQIEHWRLKLISFLFGTRELPTLCWNIVHANMFQHTFSILTLFEQNCTISNSILVLFGYSSLYKCHSPHPKGKSSALF